MNLVEKLYYKIFKSEEEYQTQVEYEARRAYIIEYIKKYISYVRHYNSYADEDEGQTKYGAIHIHYRCNIMELYKQGYSDLEIHFAAIRIYGIYGVTIKVNTANLNVYKFQRNAEYYGEYTWEDNNESKKKKQYSQYQDKTSDKYKDENRIDNKPIYKIMQNRSIE